MKPTARSVVVAAVLSGWAPLLAAQGFGSVTGLVRDISGVPLAGAEVLLANQRALTTAQGGFRLDYVVIWEKR